MRHSLQNIFYLGIKELRSLRRDTMMLVLIVFAFSGQVYLTATGVPESLHKAPIAIVDEDRSPLSERIVNAFYPPHFLAPAVIEPYASNAGMDAGLYTFILDIPPNFQRDVLAGRQPTIQLNVDATRMSQAFIGNSYIQTIVNGEAAAFVQGHRAVASLPVELETRVLFNPNLSSVWFGSVMEVLNSITMLSIVLTGAALIREREHGTIEHLLVMPLTPFEIMLAKVWSRRWHRTSCSPRRPRISSRWPKPSCIAGPGLAWSGRNFWHCWRLAACFSPWRWPTSARLSVRWLD